MKTSFTTTIRTTIAVIVLLPATAATTSNIRGSSAIITLGAPSSAPSSLLSLTPSAIPSFSPSAIPSFVRSAIPSAAPSAVLSSVEKVRDTKYFPYELGDEDKDIDEEEYFAFPTWYDLDEVPENSPNGTDHKDELQQDDDEDNHMPFAEEVEEEEERWLVISAIDVELGSVSGGDGPLVADFDADLEAAINVELGSVSGGDGPLVADDDADLEGGCNDADGPSEVAEGGCIDDDGEMVDIPLD